MQKQIYLCGFMGAGKSTLLKRLAVCQEINCYDLDELLLNEAQEKTVGALIEKKGWPFFRALEQQKISQLLASDESFVLALGGGALSAELAKMLNEKGALIWLKTPFDICYERILMEGEKRPLLAQGKATLLELFNERQALYSLSRYHFSLEIQEQIQSPVDLLDLIKN